ncbi:multiubiquitin domain-containing protein [Paenarthrobacter sp. Z7-10]|uniref:multiubiquitin domain-containing protein n=1 Tax=Paenarthrobacter sp. Z7-10 TaxID=2787635 RepID=UPI0022A96037|nr:multiubiquitin domain-containing protein [Paenarthrobacter sp. Z7-10]MCZ2404921.1 multiubiquitin domain-containing protein [Paenarthrobacter sp. Z7-10]
MTATRTEPLAGSERQKEKDFVIVVNGVQHDLESAILHYEELVAIAFPVPPAPDTRYTVTYRKAKDPNHEGSLAPGQWVEVKKKGTIINVKTTNRS